MLASPQQVLCSGIVCIWWSWSLWRVGTWHRKRHRGICEPTVWAWHCSGWCGQAKVESLCQEIARGTEATITGRGALHKAIARSHFQAMVWHKADVPDPQLPRPTDYGWRAEGNHLVPITSKDPPVPVPETITHLIRCDYRKSKCLSRCSCRAELLWAVCVWGRWRSSVETQVMSTSWELTTKMRMEIRQCNKEHCQLEHCTKTQQRYTM